MTSRERFAWTAVRWYAYVNGFLIVVVLSNAILWRRTAFASVDAFRDFALQPLNLFSWACATVLYAAFVVFMWVSLRRRFDEDRAG